MIVPKKMSGKDMKNSIKAVFSGVPVKLARVRNTIIATNKKISSTSNLLIFRTIRSPTMITNGRSTGVATHQDAIPIPKMLKTNAANAAGLKMCFFPNAKMYLESIAIAAARNR
jgi:hypothetical protein